MDGNFPDDDDQNSLSLIKDEGMEATMTTQLENLPVTRNDNLQTEAGGTHGLPLGSVCKEEDFQSEELSKRSHTETSSTLPEMNSHNLASKEGKEMEVTMVTHDVTQTLEEEMGAVRTASSAASLLVKFECVDEDSEDSDSDSSSSSSSTSSSSSSFAPAPVFEDFDEGVNQSAPIKARDEVLLEELPAVEDVSVSLPEDSELQPVGTVSSIVQQLVIIQSLKDTPPLNEDSILFRSDRVAVGKVFEVFGPVCSPLYVLRFNSADQIISKGLTEGSTVYCAPALKEYTDYILTQQLKLLKGSDASWKNDDEPPEEALDYSDDEKEQEAKRKIRTKKKENGNIDKSGQHQGHDRRGFQSRHAGPRVQRQHPRNAPPQHFHSYCPPGHTETHPSYCPPHSHYLPSPSHPPPRQPFSPPSFPLYPPPPLPPPAFFNPSFSPPFWPPNSVPYVDFTLPPPPPPPPLPPSPPH